jgi:hypothetical protein
MRNADVLLSFARFFARACYIELWHLDEHCRSAAAERSVREATGRDLFTVLVGLASILPHAPTADLFLRSSHIVRALFSDGSVEWMRRAVRLPMVSRLGDDTTRRPDADAACLDGATTLCRWIGWCLAQVRRR